MSSVKSNNSTDTVATFNDLRYVFWTKVSLWVDEILLLNYVKSTTHFRGLSNYMEKVRPSDNDGIQINIFEFRLSVICYEQILTAVCNVCEIKQ